MGAGEGNLVGKSKIKNYYSNSYNSVNSVYVPAFFHPPLQTKVFS